MRRLRRHSKPLSEINVVPYIDVMLVLLIIFMITAPLLTEGVNVDLPQAEAKTLTNEDEIPIIVSVDSNGNYYLNISEHADRPIASTDLLEQIKAALSVATRTVLVKGDSHVAYGKVMDAMVLLQQAGVDNVGLMTKPLEL